MNQQCVLIAATIPTTTGIKVYLLVAKSAKINLIKIIINQLFPMNKQLF